MSNIIKLIQTKLGNKVNVDSAGRLNITANSVNLTDYNITEIIDQKDEVNSGFKNLLGTTDTQTFTVGSQGILTSNFGYYVYSGSSGLMRFILIDISTGVTLASIYVTINSGDNGWFTQAWNTSVFLKANTQCRILYTPNSGTDTIKIGYDSTGSYSGGSMGSNPAQDYMFRIYGVKIPSIALLTGEITALSQNFNYFSAPSSTNAITETSLQNFTYDFYNNTKSFAVGTAQVSTATWFMCGFFQASDFISGVNIISEVFLQNYSTLAISRIFLKTSWMTSTTVNNSYSIDDGTLSALRPVARIYRNPTSNTLYIYFKIPSPTYLSMANYIYNMHGISNVQGPGYMTIAGTGTDPNGVTGYTLLYDSSTNDAGLPAPKTVSASAGFWSTPPTFSLSFGKNGNTIIAYFDKLSATSSGAASSVITLAAGTIPVKFITNNVIGKTIWGIDNNNWYLYAIRIFTDGSAIITRVQNFNNMNANIAASGGNAYGWESFSVSWTMKNT